MSTLDSSEFERRTAQYIAAGRARSERGVGSIGLPGDTLKEVLELASLCAHTFSCMRAASVEFKAAIEAHEDVLLPALVEARFPTAVQVAKLCRSPPCSAADWKTLYRRHVALGSGQTPQWDMLSDDERESRVALLESDERASAAARIRRIAAEAGLRVTIDDDDALMASNEQVEPAPDRHIFSLEVFTCTSTCSTCALEQLSYYPDEFGRGPRCQVCDAELPVHAINESRVLSWAGQPDIENGDMLIRVPPEIVVRQWEDIHQIRLIVTRASDGKAAKLCQAVAEEGCLHDGEIISYAEYDFSEICHRSLTRFVEHDLNIQLDHEDGYTDANGELELYPVIGTMLYPGNGTNGSYFTLKPRISIFGEQEEFYLQGTDFIKLLDTCVTFA